MTSRAQYVPSPATAEEFSGIWSNHMDALDRHLSIHRWAMAAVTVVLIAYPIARMALPALLHGIVPDVVRNVLHWI